MVWAVGPFIVCRSLSFSICPVSLLWAFSLCLRALSVYACGPLYFTPTGSVFYAYGPSSFVTVYALYCRLALWYIILLSENTARHFGSLQNSLFLDMSSDPRPGPLSPPQVYQDSARRIRRRPPQSFIVRRPCTRPSAAYKPLLTDGR